MPKNVLVRLVVLKPGFSFTVDAAKGPAASLYNSAKGSWDPYKDGATVTGTAAKESILLSYDNDNPPALDLTQAASIVLLTPGGSGEDPWPVPPPPPPPANVSFDKLATRLRKSALDGSWALPGDVHVLP